MKDYEKYAEEVKKDAFNVLFEYVTSNKELTELAIWKIQGQIEAIMSLELPKSDYAIKVEYLQKSLNYLKEKL